MLLETFTSLLFTRPSLTAKSADCCSLIGITRTVTWDPLGPQVRGSGWACFGVGTAPCETPPTNNLKCDLLSSLALVVCIYLDSSEIRDRHNSHADAHVSQWQLEDVRSEPTSINVFCFICTTMTIRPKGKCMLTTLDGTISNARTNNTTQPRNNHLSSVFAFLSMTFASGFALNTFRLLNAPELKSMGGMAL